MDIKEMEESGVYDYYDKLNKWMNHFVNRNYPLSKEDLIALTNGETTENEYRIQGLVKSTNYSIYVIAYDNAGNPKPAN